MSFKSCCKLGLAERWAGAGASVLGSDEVDRMVKDAETNATSDKAKRDAIDTKNNVSPRPTHPLLFNSLGSVLQSDHTWAC